MNNKEERIAKLIARAGVCSRRDAERLIEEGRITYQGKVIQSPALKLSSLDEVLVDGKKVKIKQTRLWLYHKPVGLVVSHKDDQDRQTIFDNLNLGERVISVGRLDKNTAGLLLLTNDGELARKLELPQNNFQRVYMVRVFGSINFNKMKTILSNPINIDGVIYKPMEIELHSSSNSNYWLKLTISEGKNREIRNVMNYFNLRINRLVRIQYGEFFLGDLEPGNVIEILNYKKFI
jgi:23S rRNA pseudouridine2605 synthase